MNYQVKRDGQVKGPYSLEAMRERLERGEIDEGALFRRVGSEHWLAAVDLREELEEQARLSARAVVPPPVPAVVAAPRGTALQPVEMKRLDIPFSDIFMIVLKTMIAILLASPILVAIVLLIMVAVSLLGAVLLVGAK